MSQLFLPASEPLTLPDSDKRILRRPDLRGLLVPRLSGAPLSNNEVDYDDLIIHRTYRSYDPTKPAEVRYMMYELSQRDPGSDQYHYFWKAIRLARVTRVPRYLRRSTVAGPNAVFEQQRDILSALRENQVLFLNLIAKSATLPMIFAYGAQGVGDSPEAAQKMADEGWAVLSFQLDGQFQQLEYQQLTMEEAESLVRYQSEWQHIGMARGRPVAAGGNFGAANLFDGNRTEVESTLNQLESFLRGMVNREFMLSLVTTPISPKEMTLAWRNITTKLSSVRSEMQGSRSLTVGVALPLSMGQSLANSAGTGHSVGVSTGTGQTNGVSHTLTAGTNQATSVGTTHGTTQGTTVGQSTGLASSNTHTLGTNQGTSASASQGSTVGTNASTTQSQTATAGTNQGTSLTQTAGTGTSQGTSLSQTNTAGTNSSQSVGQSLTASHGTSQGISQSGSTSTAQSLTDTGGTSTSFGNSTSSSNSSSVHGGLPGVLGGGQTTGGGTGQNSGTGTSNSVSDGLTSSVGNSTGVNSGVNDSLSQGLNTGLSQGVSNSTATAAGINQGTNTSQSLASGLSQGTSQSLSVASGLSQGVSNSQNVGTSLGSSQGVSDSLATGTSLSQGVSNAVSNATSNSVSNSTSQGTSFSNAVGTSQATSTNQGVTDSSMTNFGQSVSTTAGVGAVPSVGAAFSRNVYDEAKRMLGDVLAAQANRYLEGVEGGAFFYQMFLVTPDRPTLLGAAGLLKSAFWGLGNVDQRLPQPFHAIVDFDDEDEPQRLLTHARAFTQYRRREREISLIEPYMYSTYVTMTEAAAFCHPPTNENPGIKGMADSMPVLTIPTDRQNRDIPLGHVINGELARVSGVKYGIDVDELTHTLLAGVTGVGKTTTLMTMLTEISRVTRTIVEHPTPANPYPRVREVKAGILGLDWMTNLRDLASVVEPERFRFFSIAKPELGAFRWNPLALPDDQMDPVEWAGDMADNMTISFGLGEFGRSIIAELMSDLYSANRLEPFPLRSEVRDPNTGIVLREGVYLPPVDITMLPAGAVQTAPDGTTYANVLTCPALSRLVSMADLATLVLNKVEEAATVEGARLHGPAFRDRIQSLWRRVQYFAPGSMFEGVFSCDERLDVRTTLNVTDLVDPDKGLVTILETDGLDIVNRRFVLGSVLLAVWRYGQFKGQGCFNQNGQGPGTFVCLEEAHELFGEQNSGEDAFSASTRTALYESMFRRSRALGMKLVVVVQNCSAIPEAVTSNTTTVMIHRQKSDADKRRAFSLLNWDHTLAAQLREFRYLGEMPMGYLIIVLDAKKSYLESAPVQILVEPAALSRVSDSDLAALASLHH